VMVERKLVEKNTKELRKNAWKCGQYMVK
jgi:hypothetical protein